jgi:hypothetical protein
MPTTVKCATHVIGDSRHAKEGAMKRKLTTLAIFGMILVLTMANALAANGTWLFTPYTGSG